MFISYFLLVINKYWIVGLMYQWRNLLICLVAYLIWLGFGWDRVQAAPPADFQTSLIIGTGLNGPSGFEIAPDGRIFILERTGAVKIYKNGQLLSEPFVVLPSIATGDRGLIGIAFDPDYFTNHYVYFYYTGLDKLNRLVRFNAEGDTATEGPVYLYETTFPSEQLHVGGAIQFGPDGKLYFAVGDNGYPPNAELLNNPHGKILRLNKNGSIPSDNPFVNTAEALPEIWAYGLRNPWRFQFDPVTGFLYSADVGDFTIEEMNRIVRGGNYGWPNAEGFCSDCDSIDPLYAWPHNGNSAAAVGGPVYRGSMFPADYYGSLFFGDYAMGFIRRMSLDEAGNNTGVYDFDPVAGSVVDIKAASDGSLYYLTYYPGRLYRITYSQDNPAPVANAGVDSTKGQAPFTVAFTSAGSQDPNGDILTYNWDFGDGTSSTLANPSKTYTADGTYIVELTVSDGVNQNKAIPIIIQVGIPPTVTIGLPVDGDTYIAGDEIVINAHAIDAVGNDISDSNYSTEVVFHHDTHIHPFYGPFPGRAHSFVVPTTGEADPDIWYEIKVTATDTNGLSSTDSVNIYAVTSEYTINSQPQGLEIKLDGSPVVTPTTRESLIGFEREISTPFIQKLNNDYYQFNSWSDGKQISHTITVADLPTTYTAEYLPVQPFSAVYFDNPDLSGQPVITRQDAFIDFVWDGASPDPDIPADGFSARWQAEQYFLAGTYEFTTATDDGVRLYIDGQLVIDKWQDQGTIPYTYQIELTEGNHQIMMEYYERAGGSVAKLTWNLIEQGEVIIEPPIEADVVGEYWNVTNIPTSIPSTNPDLIRQETSINFDWGGGSPDPVINTDNFVARWTQGVYLNEGQYTFTTKTDDGVRLYLDGQLVIDKWLDQAATTYQYTSQLAAGDHQIVMEYYEKGGGAVAQLEWQYNSETDPDPAPSEYFRGRYWNTPGSGANPTLPTTTPDLERQDLAVNFDWGGGSPDPVITPDNFIAVWEKTQPFTAGTYEFSTTSDDGVRLYVDDQLLIDRWIDQGPTTYTAQIQLTAGEHSIRMEYYENGGGALAKLAWQLVDDPQPSADFLAQYWNTPGTGSSPAIPTTTPDLVRTESTINHDWGGGSPDPVITSDNFLAVWEKSDTFAAGRYEFVTSTDDGVRLYIDGQLVIDKWLDQGTTSYIAQLDLADGEHSIRMEYYENAGGAVAELSYSLIQQSSLVLGDFTAEYWNTPAMNSANPVFPTTSPDYVTVVKTIDYDWGGGSPHTLITDDTFMARWSLTQDFTAGEYSLRTESDDGMRVWVDGSLVWQNWTLHGRVVEDFQISLSAGEHTLIVEYFEYSGGAVARFEQL